MTKVKPHRGVYVQRLLGRKNTTRSRGEWRYLLCHDKIPAAEAPRHPALKPGSHRSLSNFVSNPSIIVPYADYKSFQK